MTNENSEGSGTFSDSPTESMSLTRASVDKILSESLEDNPLPAWIYDTETLAFLEVTRAAISKYGYSRREFLSMTILDIHPAGDIPALLHSTLKPHGPSPEPKLWRHRTKDGALIDVMIDGRELLFRGRHAELIIAYPVSDSITCR